MLQTPWIRRFVALLILVTVIVAIINLGILPLIRAHQELDKAILETRDILEKYHALVRDAPYKAEQDFSGLNVAYLEHKSESLAAADLQGRVNVILSDSGAEVASLQQLPVKDDHGVRRLTIRAQFVAKNQSMITIFRSLETQAPWLFLDNLSIQSRATPKIDDPKNDDPNLSISVDLYGYLRASTP